MKKQKTIRQKGKESMSSLFKEIKEGDKVVLIHQPGSNEHFPRRFHGRMGIVIGSRGKSFIVAVKDGNVVKKFNAQKINLKKVSS